jgi:hypothetical protein
MFLAKSIFFAVYGSEIGSLQARLILFLLFDSSDPCQAFQGFFNSGQGTMITPLEIVVVRPYVYISPLKN